MNGFKSGHYQIMVAIDIAARGLDVESISHVINFDIPDTADAYIHRIGRTGRMERNGAAFTLVTPDDKDMIRALEKIMGQPPPRQTLTDFDYSLPMRDTAPAAHKPASARVDARRALAARGVKLMDHPTQTARPAQQMR
ncbi:MAG: C-terminal helicase domain-containing protein [Anaerolineales bacterium]|nr:C-terminal helicase domain-containing protein [Anaerolineales bacterium]